MIALTLRNLRLANVQCHGWSLRSVIRRCNRTSELSRIIEENTLTTCTMRVTRDTNGTPVANLFYRHPRDE